MSGSGRVFVPPLIIIAGGRKGERYLLSSKWQKILIRSLQHKHTLVEVLTGEGGGRGGGREGGGRGGRGGGCFEKKGAADNANQPCMGCC